MKFRITNIVMTGKSKHKFSMEDFAKIVKKGKIWWDVLNEDCSPLLQARIPAKGTNIYGKQKTTCVSFWQGGSVNIVGCKSRKEGIEAYKKAVKDIREALRT